MSSTGILYRKSATEKIINVFERKVEDRTAPPREALDVNSVQHLPIATRYVIVIM
jgi:hypothetical protein